ncbi:tryptophan-rich sensory protein [Nostocoides sp. F2B08]|uniref:tryptophan-rich sensory protein n=1 Tax=Nostocoides sp. F2B08 TaxID=2653936 RepID=UPI001D050771|nr:tryptophan-rich sensory protein [Tetrasphaera sp. F2B08]
MTETRQRALPTDRRRQVWVTVCFVAGIVGVLFGVGVLGERVEESPGGDLAADATLLAPASPAFSIWTVIYLGLTAYTVYQWLPEQATDRRHRAIGGLAGVSMLLNAAWLLVTQQGWIWVSVAVILALAAVLVRLVFLLQTTPSYGIAETLMVDLTFGLYLGWVLAASGANVGAALSSSNAGPGRWTAIALIVVVTIVGAALLRLFSGRFAVAGALAWGLGWIAIGRLFDEPSDALVGIVAAVCAVVILAVAWTSQERRAVIDDRIAI